MRISDWSSDVCSSDLGGEFGKDDVLSGDEELDAEDAVAAEIVDHLARHILCVCQRLGVHARRLPAFHIVSALLPLSVWLADDYALSRAFVVLCYFFFLFVLLFTLLYSILLFSFFF